VITYHGGGHPDEPAGRVHNPGIEAATLPLARQQMPDGFGPLPSRWRGPGGRQMPRWRGQALGVNLGRGPCCRRRHHFFDYFLSGRIPTAGGGIEMVLVAGYTRASHRDAKHDRQTHRDQAEKHEALD
jgi:hypothetical protein